MGNNQAISVEKARGGMISDPVLDRIIAAGHALQREEATAESDLVLIIQNLPQLAEELRQYRQAMALVNDISQAPSNVIFLPQH
ncbi:hypothetical protein [Seohaeicola zhoushanensis]|uniref:Uncharacterized protein n=1 Tax=Seohaeicola zhoushanensis TaxID=1569283 RepID=A0A8J3M416_9RHOB|nr:hypothetical protein [Seohaeicola zhoushanensis]GHF33124.1 hypothetical protein GCM10017056_00660 [Seohaeicola zhoushanensis]